MNAWCEWSSPSIIVTCSSWLTLICVDGHTLRHKGPGLHTHLPLSPSLSASLCHLCSFISIALLPCFLSPCHVQSLFGWPGTQSGRQGAGAPGRELPNRRQDGHWNDSNNGVPVWPRQASQLAGPGWGVISVWCLQGKEVWGSTANPEYSSQGRCSHPGSEGNNSGPRRQISIDICHTGGCQAVCLRECLRVAAADDIYLKQRS